MTTAPAKRALNAEMDHHLAGGGGAWNSRKRDGRKSVVTDTGRMALEVPRDRHGRFDPLLIAKYQGRFHGFDDKITAMYARGMRFCYVQQAISLRCTVACGGAVDGLHPASQIWVGELRNERPDRQ